ncbi:TetR/AcrR family transcriptional regulator [Brachybacterium kimchii]|uniref:TetR family transcriptional regulator n=1 Tax=Brachybacterium kimchii TaxID=2942909 RepID=A0ABY4N3S5_9MICO|nr:hypothetical protein [Brachybacterium kimchii]UQN28511.1 hypothetical protein M4486_12805 [Brachybacterium kimchii]
MSPDPAPSSPASSKPAPSGRALRTGPKPRFTADQAVDAALGLGIERFTLAGVAAALGISAPALYRVVDSHEDLVDLCLARIAGQMRLPTSGASWQDQLRFFADETWRLTQEHPGLPATILERPGAHLHLAGTMRALIGSLEAADFPGGAEEIAFALDFLGDTVFVTHIGILPYRQADASGRRGIDRALEKQADLRGAAWTGAGDGTAGHDEHAGRAADSGETAAVGDGPAAGDDDPGAPSVLTIDESWTGRGMLDRKIDFIIAGIEQGLLSTP